MSDPVTNSEIEDVLTSIRRLVSENRPLAETSDTTVEAAPATFDVTTAQQEPEPVDDAPLALVLTPSLRVPQEDAPEDFSDTGEAPLVLEAEQPEVEALEIEEVPEEETEEFSFEEASAEDSGELVDDDVEASEISEPLQADAMATVESIDEVEDNAEEVEDATWSEQADVDALEFTADAEVLDEAPDEAVDEEQPFDFKKVLETRIHQFREATSAEDVTPDMVEAETDAPDMAAAVMEDLRVSMPEEIAQSVELPDTGELSSAMDEAAEIDEAMLREMVSDIVRQELQGALGERITRNVRKLVRREIHRALAAHDLG